VTPNALWEEVPLESICDVVQGQSPPGSTYNDDARGIPFLQGKADFGALYPSIRKWCTQPSKLAYPGDVLLSIRAPVGPTNLADQEVCIGRGLAAIRPRGGVSSKYVLYALRSTERELSERGTGSTFDAVSGAVVRSHVLPVAPLGEQHRIVAAIEEQFTRLDAAVASLQRARANLKRYRASVLAAAVDGRLINSQAASTRDNAPSLTSEELLALALDEHPHRSNAFHQEDDTATPTHSSARRHPAGWSTATVGQLASRVQYGTSAKTDDHGEGIPILRMGNIVDGRLTFGRLKYLPEDHVDLPGLMLEPGDILFNRTNSAELVGKSAVYRGHPNPCSFASYLIRVQLAPGYVPDFLVFYLNSMHGRAWVKSVVSQQVGQANVNGTKLQDLCRSGAATG
jgi:type I restriction enzyme S subunit